MHNSATSIYEKFRIDVEIKTQELRQMKTVFKQNLR